ncbi:MAG: hypothetical protein V7640_310 [Betaproteobacteria bacterium]
MLRTVFHTAVEHLATHEALAAWQVYATMRASHHIFPFRRRLGGSTLDLLFIAFQNPVQEREARHEQEYFGQPTIH